MLTARRPAEDANGQLEFVAGQSDRTVHVVATEAAHDPVNETVGFAEGLTAWARVMGRTVALCGLVIWRDLAGNGNGGTYILEFADDRLCRRCHKALGEESARAFEHPTP